MHFFRYEVPADDCLGVASRVLPGGRPGEAGSTQTLVTCRRALRPLQGADALGGLELGPPLQLYAEPAAREGEPAAARRTHTPTAGLSFPVWDPFSSAFYMREGNAIVRLSSDDTVTVVAGDVEEQGDADGPGRTARFMNPCYLASDGAGSLYLADKHHFRRLQLPPVVRPVAGQLDVQPQAAAGDGPAAALAAAGCPVGGPQGNQAGVAEGEVLVSTLVPHAPGVVMGMAYDGSGSGGGSGSGSGSGSSSDSLVFMAGTALYRLPLGDPTAAPLLLAGDAGAASAADDRGDFQSSWGLVLDGEGSVYVADWVVGGMTDLRRVAADGTATIVVADLEGLLALPAILPNGCLVLNNHHGDTLQVLGLGLKLPRCHAATAVPAAPTGPPPRTLPADLRALLDRQPDSTADVAIVVSDRTFHAHRGLLSARSDFFKQRFGGGFADGSAQQLSLPDADPDACGVVLCWVYTGTADIPAALAAGVAELADQLLLPELCKQALVVVEASVSAVTVVGLLLWAEAHGPAFSDLLSRLKGWYVDNREAVLREAKEEARLLMERSPNLMLELMHDGCSPPAKRTRTG
ncbi:ARM REPEAT PROTEIN INTERACTING WITH ABF2 [Tetrabaena socialis]|uniref:ARM REPEAT PROTEIN INTERACTING WITH ABF2 n=1 Tax=Tetrabaena socialis TaxID=47790 RepID=A0A2J8ADX7_9CHLO|nr:ARM REPEAT PROTEIN INTERACTING WITH ABF2 [Tetrabaena socialis]|eukprot:PNH10738.1 ARM REPEAT PROTEIN INTERACTING WITH ABF2 [Tetrabaena socialis]